MKRIMLVLFACLSLGTGSAYAACWSAWVSGPSSVFKGETHTYTASFSASCGNPQIIAVTKKIKYRKPNLSWTSYTTGATRSINFSQGGTYRIKANYKGEVESVRTGVTHPVSTNRYKNVFVCTPSTCV